MTLVWCDLETSGLDEQKCSVLEIAAIVTDDALNEVARLQRVVYYPPAAQIVEMLEERRDYDFIHAVLTPQLPFGCSPHTRVLEMHDKNGLWRDCVHGFALDTVDRELAAFVRGSAVEQKLVTKPDGSLQEQVVLPQLAGSTISFDRRFIDVHLPRLAKTLHYRSIDVSGFNETAKRFWPAVYDARPRAANGEIAHRGMADIESSIAVYKHYLSNLGPKVSGVTVHV